MVKNPSANGGDVRDTILSLGREDPLEKDMATHSYWQDYFLPEESHRQRSLVGYSTESRKESDMTKAT